MTDTTSVKPEVDFGAEEARAGFAERLAAIGRGIGRNPVMAVASLTGILLLALAVFAPWLAPFDPGAQKLLARLRPPSGFERSLADHWLGTDQLGRDLLSRCLYGLRLTLGMALAGAVVGLLIGATLGLVSGFVGGLTDAVIMGMADIQLSIPFTLVALVVFAMLGGDLLVLVGCFGLAYWAHFTRLIRAQVMALRTLPYIEAARAIGTTNLRIVLKHMLPNIVSPVIVMFTLNISNLILLESSLSFIGIGVQPPTASLGSMVGHGRDYMATAPWIVAAPALLIALVSLAIMLIGDWLRDRFDVVLRDR